MAHGQGTCPDEFVVLEQEGGREGGREEGEESMSWERVRRQQAGAIPSSPSSPRCFRPPSSLDRPARPCQKAMKMTLISPPSLSPSLPPSLPPFLPSGGDRLQLVNDQGKALQRRNQN